MVSREGRPLTYLANMAVPREGSRAFPVLTCPVWAMNCHQKHICLLSERGAFGMCHCGPQPPGLWWALQPGGGACNAPSELWQKWGRGLRGTRLTVKGRVSTSQSTSQPTSIPPSPPSWVPCGGQADGGPGRALRHVGEVVGRQDGRGGPGGLGLSRGLAKHKYLGAVSGGLWWLLPRGGGAGVHPR